MDSTDDLRLLLVCRHSLIVAEMRDEGRFMGILRRAAQIAGFPVWTWSVTRGLARDGMGSQTGTNDPKRALEFVRQLLDPGVFVFHDAQPALSEPVVVRLIKEISQEGRSGQTIVLTGPTAQIPDELAGIALPWTLEPPSRDELGALVRRTIDDLAARGFPVAMASEDVDGLVEAVSGLTTPEAERLVLHAALADGRLDEADVADVREAKAHLLAADGVLELVPVQQGLEGVGGLERLKEWLAERGRGFEPAAREFGLDPPRGVLLTGVPGCGKSLVAKTLAQEWRMPLVLFDPGRIYGSYVGESEARLRSSLLTVEAMAPVVLWIDEVEKGFASDSASADSGVSRRVLGSFLHWMQERPDGVFLVATCNDVRSLPTELLRRGRFDEIFFVDLPGRQEREEILRLHLRRHDRDPSSFDLASLVAATDGFTGAELEGVIVGAMYAAFAAKRDLRTEGLLEEIRQTIPIAATRAEDVAALRAWARGRATPATERPGG